MPALLRSFTYLNARMRNLSLWQQASCHDWYHRYAMANATFAAPSCSCMLTCTDLQLSDESLAIESSGKCAPRARDSLLVSAGAQCLED